MSKRDEAREIILNYCKQNGIGKYGFSMDEIKRISQHNGMKQRTVQYYLYELGIREELLDEIYKDYDRKLIISKTNYSRLNDFIRANCKDKLCKECDLWERGKCRHEDHPRVRLVEKGE